MFKPNLRTVVTCVALALASLASGVASAAGASAAVSKRASDSSTWDISGYARAGFYQNVYRTLLPTRRSISFGGGVVVKSPKFSDFRIGAAIYTAQPFGLNSDDPRHVGTTMPSGSLTTLGQLYIEYDHHGLNVKVGDQELDTPFANSTDLQMIPLMYQGATLRYQTQINGLSLHAARITRFKPYNDHFFKGDSGKRSDQFLTNPASKTPSIDSSGFSVLGLKYVHGGVKTQLWYYHMNDRIDIAYGEFGIRFNQKVYGQKPFLALQYVRQWNSEGVNPVYKNANADLYGVKFGFGNRVNTFFLAFTKNPIHNGAYRGGGVVSPYQVAIYNGSPFFTVQPTLGYTTNQQPGWASAIRDVIHTGKFVVAMGYTHFHIYSATDFYGVRLNGTMANGRFVVIHYRPTPRNHFKLVASYINTGTHVPGRIMATRFFYTYSFGH